MVPDPPALSLSGEPRVGGSRVRRRERRLRLLANNHVLDYEEVALRDTLGEPDDAGIARSGAGRALDGALKPAVVSTGSATVAIVAFTDNAPEYAVGYETTRNRSGRRSTA